MLLRMVLRLQVGLQAYAIACRHLYVILLPFVKFCAFTFALFTFTFALFTSADTTTVHLMSAVHCRWHAGNVYRPHIDGAWPGSGLDANGRYVFDAYGKPQLRLCSSINAVFLGLQERRVGSKGFTVRDSQQGDEWCGNRL
jgi:hypothetical protein